MPAVPAEDEVIGQGYAKGFSRGLLSVLEEDETDGLKTRSFHPKSVRLALKRLRLV